MMTNSFALCSDPVLGRLVKSFWQTEGTPAHNTETIFPKGVVELIFSFDEAIPYFLFSKDEQNKTPRCFVCGITDIPIQLLIPARQFFFGVTMQPWAVQHVLHIPSGEFRNSIIDLELLDKNISILWHQLSEARSFNVRINLIREWMLTKNRSPENQSFVLSQFLFQHQLPSNVKTLAAEYCYSPRQLHRKVKELFGMSSEGLIRYKRYLTAVQLLHHGNDPLTSICYDCNYYDQAHFIREFKEFTGVTPGTYRKMKSELPSHIFQ